jgi:BirA family biotin operon repressor/biotin-[acetyl-CoA-carboxylase] ligase
MTNNELKIADHKSQIENRIPDLLDPDKIKANLKTERIGGKILIYNSTSSTQTIAAEYAKNELYDGLVIFAEEQNMGRGRAANQWLSGRADSILCSIVLIENNLSAELLSLTFAVAVAEAIGSRGGSLAKIKWPNDIMLNGKKVAGILLESKSLPIADCRLPISHFDSAQGEKLLHAERRRGTKSQIENRKSKIYIIGIGINCHQKAEFFTDELQNVATSIDAESSISRSAFGVRRSPRRATGTLEYAARGTQNSERVDRVLLAKRLLSSTDHWLQVAGKNGQEVIDRWRLLSIQLGRRISVLFNGKKFTGHCVGIDPEKGLILQLDTGGVRMFDAAHTSIVKSFT